MTALEEYQRLEAAGLWRANAEAQRLDVIVSIGDATLVISDTRDRPLTHWSLAAVERANPGEFPAIYYPDGDPAEQLELAEDEAQMIEGIEKLRAAVGRHRPHPGRLRLVMFLASMAAAGAVAVFWLPEALRAHAVSVVPDVKREQIGDALMAQIQRVTGAPCAETSGVGALEKLSRRLPEKDGPTPINVMRGGVRDTIQLPGGRLLVNRALVEDYEEPDVLAGFIVAERMRAQIADPLDRLLLHSGVLNSVRLLTTGDLPEETLKAYAERLLTTPRAALDDDTLLRGFTAWSVRARPYAYAIDISGETTLGLIEADPFATEIPPPILSDADWLRLQGICGG